MSVQIHPTAIVDKAADLGVDVKVGPYAILEAGCVVGDRSEIRGHAVIRSGTRMGARNQIGFGAIIGGEPQDYAYKNGNTWVELGAGNRIGEYVTIHRATTEGTATTIGSECFLMGGVHVGHDVGIGNHAILANNTLLSGYVKVGEGAFLGGATIVHQHTRIGRLAITRGGTRLGKDVPPFFMATDTNLVSGINRIGLRRAGFSQDTRRSIQAAFDLLFHSSLNVTQALVELERKFHLPEVVQLMEFIRESKRGICRAERGAAGDDE